MSLPGGRTHTRTYRAGIAREAGRAGLTTGCDTYTGHRAQDSATDF